MSKFISIKEAASALGVSTQTLRRWERINKLIPAQRTKGGQRRYNVAQLSLPSHPLTRDKELPTIAYARVSSHDQKEDLQRQEQMLEFFCASRGWTFEIISDLGSGLNYSKKGLRKLLSRIVNGEIRRLVLTHKDCLLRFGSELVFALCEAKEIEIVIVNQGETPTFEEELASDVLEIITVFSARLYGSRSHKNKKLMENLKQAVDDVKK
ncbi:MAG: IS607 family transposase [Rhabdochlamydiaceae bacterium]